MRIAIDTRTDFAAPWSGLTAVAVSQPLVASAADLGLPGDAGERLLAEARASGFDGETGGSLLASGWADGPRWIALIGAGRNPRPADYRRVGARLVKLARQCRVDAATLAGASSKETARFAAEGIALAGYQFDAYRTRKPEEEKVPRFQRATLVVSGDAGLTVRRADDVSQSVCLARDLANEHPGRCTPAWLGEQAEAVAHAHGMECRIRGDEELAAEGFQLILAVGRGSAEPSRLIHLTYRGGGPIRKKIALVGKGVTYDSGGYSLKPPASQLNMHLDMGGAAAVIGAADAIGRTRPESVEVHFIVPAAENLVSGEAYKLNEIVRAHNGTTVEIHNTDAEGRLLLADALSYASKLGVDEIVDLATLTGACVVALGMETAGLLSSDDRLATALLDAAGAVDESMWRLPLTERMDEQLKSDVADVKNVGSRWGGAISAALFLRRFVGDAPWAHIDIAGPAMTESEWEWINKGGTGFGVLALHEYVTRAGHG